MLEAPIKINKNLTVGPDPDENFIEYVNNNKFKSVINLSNKGEFGQTLSPEEEAALLKAEAKDIKYIHHPISVSRMNNNDFDELCAALNDLPTPVYIHCRAGQRALPLALIFHAVKKKLSGDQALRRAKELGIDWKAPMLPAFIKQYLKNNTEQPASS